MKVRLLSVLTVLTAVCAPQAHAASPTGVRMLTCTPWEEDSGGSVTYSARMNSVPGTARMSLRIRLLERFGDGRFQRVSAEGLGVWRKSRPDASEFRYEQRVRGLRQGAVYRVLVRYRWHDAAGNLIRAERRRSARCSTGGGLPNLRVASIRTQKGEVEETAVYKVKIVNDGIAEAHNVGVLLRVDGEIVDEAEVIEVLQPGETRMVTFSGPVCRQRIRAIVDPKELIDESRERDNVLGPACL